MLILVLVVVLLLLGRLDNRPVPETRPVDAAPCARRRQPAAAPGAIALVVDIVVGIVVVNDNVVNKAPGGMVDKRIGGGMEPEPCRLGKHRDSWWSRGRCRVCGAAAGALALVVGR